MPQKRYLTYETADFKKQLVNSFDANNTKKRLQLLSLASGFFLKK